MSRARATALALVNWKGVFYERYLLDRHVTALEGANGAGKTTVMIAAYVVLLPDMTRLRFTNVGESGASGGDRGVWGRLGAPERPSYAALEFEVGGGERIVAGVKLERRAEPSLDLAPFIVSGAGPGSRLRELLLVHEGADELVPDLDELRANVARAGARIEVFASAKDYFAALFDRGVSPLRLGTDEERNKLNEMLRTSMTGGISRALTTDLRAFLLKEETGLGEALLRIRANLDACHRTRIEVQEARRLERELVGVHEAAQAVLVAGALAARASVDEHAARALRSAAHRDDVARTASELKDASAAAHERHRAVLGQLDASRAASERAAARLESALRAQAILDRARALEPERASAAERALAAAGARDAAAAALEARRRERDGASEDRERAARGLADLQSGLEELHRGVQARRHALRCLASAREALADARFEPEDVDAALERARAALDEVDRRRAVVARDRESSRIRRDEHARARAALSALAGEVEDARAHEQARAVLARLSALEAGLGDLEGTRDARDRAAELAGRQAAARERATALGVPTAVDAPHRHVERLVAEAEAELRAAEELVHAEEARAAAARRSAEEAHRQIAALERAAARWREVAAIAARLESALASPVQSRSSLAAARARLARDGDAARARAADATRRRQALIEQSAALQAPAVAVHPDLLRLRDELGAELLTAQFDDLGEAEAARVQAELGARVDALVVEDPIAAAQRLAGQERAVDTVWLVGPGAERPAGTVLEGGDVIVEEPFGIRVTRVPDRATLGRKARDRAAAAMRAQAAALDAALDAEAAALRALEDLAADADRLLEDVKVLEGGDPAEETSRLRATAGAAQAEERAAFEAARAARARAAAARQRMEALRTLFGEAFLLEPPDHAARARELDAALRRAAEAHDELLRSERARRELASLVDALRDTPDDLAPESLAATGAALDAERERLFRAREALEELARHRGVLAGGDLEGALTERGAIAPALEAQLERARAAERECEQSLRAAEAAWVEASAVAARGAAERDALDAQIARLREDLACATALDAPGAGVAEAQAEASKLRAQQAALEREERAIWTQAALLAERSAHASAALQAAERQAETSRRDAAPAEERWSKVRARLDEAGAPRDHGADVRGRTSAELAAEARSRVEVLVDRLSASPGGSEHAARARAAVESAADDAFVDAWLVGREWVQRRLPIPLGQFPEPSRALDGLRHELGALEQRLVRQEADLRGASGDIARGIDVQVRRAGYQVRRLNQQLQGVSFGGIGGIRVQMHRIERMEQVLAALRDGAVQEILFQPAMPIEEALDEIFRRYGGGRGGSTKILDYREYAELAVEVQRRERTEWEPASPARLSTGEAIGVGAALMMVILTEWERDANLLRAKRESGSLRFLFLDEANRLSQDNLGVLFDLCRTLDLQLLIAAPEVARADGNTTYRLVRRVGSDGREEVLVSGRRSVGSGLPDGTASEN